MSIDLLDEYEFYGADPFVAPGPFSVLWTHKIGAPFEHIETEISTSVRFVQQLGLSLWKRR